MRWARERATRRPPDRCGGHAHRRTQSREHPPETKSAIVTTITGRRWLLASDEIQAAIRAFNQKHHDAKCLVLGMEFVQRTKLQEALTKLRRLSP
jgi:hypothetical protein